LSGLQVNPVFRYSFYSFPYSLEFQVRRYHWYQWEPNQENHGSFGSPDVVAGNAITRAGCWSHARRKIVDAEKVAPEIAREAVELIGALFRVERKAKDCSVDQRLALRQAESAPVLAQLREKLLGWKEQLLPKHPMADAINYVLNQWAELNVFCNDGGTVGQ
jgi:transposase